MDFCNLVKDIQIGMFLVDLEQPVSITISTFDLDINLFMTELYDPRNPFYHLDSIYYLVSISYHIFHNIYLISLNNNIDLSFISYLSCVIFTPQM